MNGLWLLVCSEQIEGYKTMVTEFNSMKSSVHWLTDLYPRSFYRGSTGLLCSLWKHVCPGDTHWRDPSRHGHDKYIMVQISRVSSGFSDHNGDGKMTTPLTPYLLTLLNRFCVSVVLHLTLFLVIVLGLRYHCDSKRKEVTQLWS